MTCLNLSKCCIPISACCPPSPVSAYVYHCVADILLVISKREAVAADMFIDVYIVNEKGKSLVKLRRFLPIWNEINQKLIIVTAYCN